MPDPNPATITPSAPKQSGLVVAIHAKVAALANRLCALTKVGLPPIAAYFDAAQPQPRRLVAQTIPIDRASYRARSRREL